MTRIDPRTGGAVTRAMPKTWIPAEVEAVRGRVWVADPGIGQLMRIDARTLRVVKRVHVPDR